MSDYRLAKNGFFWIVVAVGALYFVGLVNLAERVFRGSVMYLILLVDALKNHQSIFPLLTTGFFINVLALIPLVWLLIKAVKALTAFAAILFSTRTYLRSLPPVRSRSVTIIPSAAPFAFTAGWLKPSIYVSSQVKRLCTPAEYASVIYHERHHQLDRDPLKKVIVQTIAQSLPNFYGKSWLFSHFETLSEINSDFYALKHLGSKKPLVAALLKLQAPHLAYASHFSSQTERFKALVGGHRPSLLKLYTSVGLLSTTLVAAVVFLSTTSVFYDCRHLTRCFKALLTPQTTHAQVAESMSRLSVASPSDHCDR